MLSLVEVLLCMLLLETIGTTATGAATVRGKMPDETDARETPVMLEFLSKYGYLEPNLEDNNKFHSDESITTAIKAFQRFVGLPVTGVPDTETIKKIKSDRCGVPDITNSDSLPLAYSHLGTRWDRNVVTWKQTQLSTKLNEYEQWSGIQKALTLWSEVTPLKFQHSQNNADMEIKFAYREHGDGPHNSFDGKNGVLAHAYRPGYGAGGDTHFDEDEAWTIGTGDGTDFITVAAHEFGHALGLGHSSDPEALMAPFYKYKENLSLHNDDIQGIQALYGQKHKTPNSRVSTTVSTLPAVTTSSTAATTTAKITHRNTTKPVAPVFCGAHFRLDAISRGPDGFLYAFHNDAVYKVGPSGLEPGYPKLISHIFPNAPRKHISATTYVPKSRKTYIFKDYQVWRYTNFSLDDGYPKILKNNWNPLAALTLTYKDQSQIFLFDHDYFWEWSPETEDMVPGYPLAMRVYFPHVPASPDAAVMDQQGNFFFFKNSSYKKLEHRGRDSQMKALGPDLFGSVCGGQPHLIYQLSQSKLYEDNETLGYRQPKFSSRIWTLIHRSKGLEKHGTLNRNGFLSEE